MLKKLAFSLLAGGTTGTLTVILFRLLGFEVINVRNSPFLLCVYSAVWLLADIAHNVNCLSKKAEENKG